VKKAHTKVGFSFFKGLVISDLETSKRIVYGDVVIDEMAQASSKAVRLANPKGCASLTDCKRIALSVRDLKMAEACESRTHQSQQS
jgi:hypothetical protein